MSSLTLLDEELALLAPGVGPRPWLDALSDDDHDAVLVGSARSLLARGLAQGSDAGLSPCGEAADLLAHLVVPGREVHLQTALDGLRQPDLTVLRPLAAGGVLVHDTSPDGVHLLSLLTAAQAREQLSAALDPHGVARGGEAAGGVAVVRVRVVDPGPRRRGDAGSRAGRGPTRPDAGGKASDTTVLEEVAVSAGDGLGRGRVPAEPSGPACPPDAAVALTALDEAGLAAWVEDLLTTPGAAG